MQRCNRDAKRICIVQRCNDATTMQNVFASYNDATMQPRCKTRLHRTTMQRCRPLYKACVVASYFGEKRTVSTMQKNPASGGSGNGANDASRVGRERRAKPRPGCSTRLDCSTRDS